jgi:hypothetical protein
MLDLLRTADVDEQPNPFLQADPLTKLLLGRFRLKVWVAALLILTVSIIPVYLMVLINNLYIIDPIACSKHNYFFTNACLKIGLSTDYAWYWYQFISWPATVLFFLWFPQGIFGAIKGLRGNKVLMIAPGGSKDRDALAEFTIRFARSYCRPIWLIVSFIILAAYMGLYRLPSHAQFVRWTSSDWFVFWYTQLFESFVLFMVFLILIRASIAVVWFNLLFREFKVDVNFLHPDKAGGMFPFGGLLVKGANFIGIYGCTLLVWILDSQYNRGGELSLNIPQEVVPIAVLYFLFAPTLFFAALSSAHLAMKQARNNFVLNISNQFKNKLQYLDSALERSDLNVAKNSIEELDQLKKIHAIASDCPTWPIDTRNIVRFYTSYLAPVVFALSLAFIMKLLNL